MLPGNERQQEERDDHTARAAVADALGRGLGARPGWGPLPEILLTLTLVTGLVLNVGVIVPLAIATALLALTAAGAALAARTPAEWRPVAPASPAPAPAPKTS